MPMKLSADEMQALLDECRRQQSTAGVLPESARGVYGGGSGSSSAASGLDETAAGGGGGLEKADVGGGGSEASFSAGQD